MNKTFVLSAVSMVISVYGFSSVVYGDKPVLVNVQIDVEDKADKDHLGKLLEEIEKRGWSITVYFTGEFATEYPEVVKYVHDKRHQIAVGGWSSGEDLTLMDYESQLDTISRSFNAVRGAIDKFHEAYVADFKPQDFKQNSDTFRVLKELKIRSNAGYYAFNTKTHPYHTNNDFIAIPVATVDEGYTDVALIDEVIFKNGTSPEEYLGFLLKRYEQSLETKEPFAISVRPSVIASTEKRMQVFTFFLDYIKETNGQVVMTDYMTTIANPYISNIVISAPDTAKSGTYINITVFFSTHCDCPEYYLKVYGKFVSESFWSWKLLAKHYAADAPIGTFSFSRRIKIPLALPPHIPLYSIRVVGRACHGVCWPTAYNYEASAQKNIVTYCIGDIEEIVKILHDILKTINECTPCGTPCSVPCAATVSCPPESFALIPGCIWCLSSNPKCYECAEAAIEMLQTLWGIISECAGWDSSLMISGLSASLEDGGIAEVNDVYADYPVDTNNDGLYDYLSVDVGINVTDAGNYSLKGWLKDGNDTIAWTSDSFNLDTGNNIVSLNFDGRAIRNQDVNGPYDFTCLLENEDGMIIDYYEGIYRTSEYNYMDFELLGFVDNFIEHTIDDNNDNYYDLLTIDADINSTKPGIYTVIGLLESDSNMIMSSQNSVELDLGIQTVSLHFDGMLIYGNKVDGPYSLSNIYIFDEEWNQIDYLKDAFVSSSYDYLEFQPSGNITGLITDANGDVLSNIYVTTKESGSIIGSDNFNDNSFGPEWQLSPDEISIVETNQQVRMSGTITNYGWKHIFYGVELDRDVEASVKVKTLDLLDGSSFSFIIMNGGPGGWYRILRHEDQYLVTGYISGQGLWESGTWMGLSSEDYTNTHVYKIICEKSKQKISCYVDNACIGIVENADFNDFRFGFAVESWFLNQYVDVRLDDFVVKEFLDYEQEQLNSAYTDANGIYTVPGLSFGSYEVKASAISDSNIIDSVAITNVNVGETSIVNFNMETGGKIRGMITDYIGNAVPNAQIEVAGVGYYSTISDSNGVYVLEGLAAGTYYLRVIGDDINLFEGSGSVYVNTGEMEILNFTLQQSGSIKGQVTDVNSMPITNVYVFLEGYETPRYIVDANGNYEIPALNEGPYTIYTDASQTEYLDDSNSIYVTLGQTSMANFVLEKGRIFVKISGHVVDMNGLPLSGAPIYIENYYSGTGVGKVTDTNGIFDINDVSSGTYEIYINEDWPKLYDYMAFGLDNINISEDLDVNVPLWRIDVSDVTVDSRLYANGDRIDVNLTVTNNESFDLDNWKVFAEIESDDEYSQGDFNTAPITLEAGDSNSFIVSVTISEDNPSTVFELWTGVMKTDYVVNSSAGLLTGWAFQDWWDDNMIQVSPDCEGANIDGINPVNFGDFVRLAAQWQMTGPGLEGDIDGNESVDGGDVSILAHYWLRNCPDAIESTALRGDLNGDQKLDIKELSILLYDWLSNDIFLSKRHRKIKLRALPSQ